MFENEVLLYPEKINKFVFLKGFFSSENLKELSYYWMPVESKG